VSSTTVAFDQKTWKPSLRNGIYIHTYIHTYIHIKTLHNTHIRDREEYDPKATCFMTLDRLKDFVGELFVPFGFSGQVYSHNQYMRRVGNVSTDLLRIHSTYWLISPIHWLTYIHTYIRYLPLLHLFSLVIVFLTYAIMYVCI
jgi:hypothetical protein